MTITVFVYIANPTGCVSGEPCPEYDYSPEYVNAWIDWDGDQVFEPDERVLDAALTGYLGINYQGTMSTSNIVTIPADAVSTTWMRVNLGWAYDPNDPCDEYWTWGDIVDREVEISPLELKVERLDALDDFDIRNVVDPIWTDASPSQYDPIADGMRNGFLFWTSPGSFKIKATIGASPETPDWEPRCVFSWSISGTDKQGSGEFTGWSGEFDVRMPQEVGKYTLNLAFSLYDNQGNKMGSQLMSHTLYATYENSELSNPKESWLQKAVEWASGATNEDEVASKINSAIHGTGWLYGYPPLRCTNAQYGGWPDLVENPSAICGDCVNFSDVWQGLVRVLGVNGSTLQRYGANHLGFVTKVNSVAPDGQQGNAHPQSQPEDRWNFAMHQIGQTGAWFWSKFYDPTFGKQYGGQDEFIDWNVTKKESYGTVLTADSHKLYLKSWSGNFGWGEWEYVSALGLSSVAASGGAGFTGNYAVYGVDDDGDGIYDSLAIDVEINATAAGDYAVVGSLRSGDVELTSRRSYDSAVASPGYPLSVSEPGLRTVTLSFSGEDIYQTGIDGIYTADLAIVDDGGSVVDSRSFDSTVQDHSDFGELPARADVVGDFGEDTDEDGLFEDLTAQVEIQVAKAMDYSLEGALYSSDGQPLTSVSVSEHLDAPGIVDLVFDGTKIRKSEKDGPYVLAVNVYDENDAQIDHEENATSAYSYLAFQDPEQAFTGTYSDYGTDTDGDGLFNYLTVEAGVAISNPGDYTVEGWLYDSTGKEVEIASSSTYLDSGTQSAILDFNGLSINRNQVDGPYYLKHLTLSGSDQLDFAEDAHTTSDYEFSEFQEPPEPLVALTGNYWDHGTDTDGDGVLDYLTVEVEVTLADAGPVVSKARLVDANGEEIVWAENVAYLEAGQPQVVRLDFEGEAIYYQGVDGPYYLRDVYIYHTGDPTQADYAYDAYTTATYDYHLFGGPASPPVGGIADLPDVSQGPGRQAASSNPPYAALAGGLAAALVAVTAGAWYARSRWQR
jgi:hypothetical protein